MVVVQSYCGPIPDYLKERTDAMKALYGASYRFKLFPGDRNPRGEEMALRRDWQAAKQLEEQIRTTLPALRAKEQEDGAVFGALPKDTDEDELDAAWQEVIASRAEIDKAVSDMGVASTTAQEKAAGAISLLPDIQAAQVVSDKYRYDLALTTDDFMWCDCDCVTIGALSFPQDKPSFAFYNDQPDSFLLYSPKAEWWAATEADRRRRGISLDTFPFMRKLLRDKDVHIIDPSLYDHLADRRRKGETV